MDKINIDEIRDQLIKYPLKEIYESIKISRNHLYLFLNKKSYNPRIETLNAMIDFINNNESK
jgi:DNA-binding phage protein